MITRIYAFLHWMTTRRDERDSGVAPGYWQYKVRTAALDACRDQTGNILDIGCGDGLFLVQLAKQNPKARIWAVDIDADIIRQAQERMKRENITGIHFSQQDAADMAFEAGIFDMIICTNVFMTMDSMETVQRTLLSMSRISRSGAVIQFDYRNALNPLLRLKYKLAPLYDATIRGRNLSTYYHSDIAVGLVNARMSIVSRKCMGLPLLRFLAPVIIIKARKL